MSFKFWPKSPLPEDIAYRYVCIPHTPRFWDHVVVGTHTFKVQYECGSQREVNVVLDCTPSESPTFVHILCLLATKCGMERVDLSLTQHRPSSDFKYTFNLKYADALFKGMKLYSGKTIDIVEEFTCHHNDSFEISRVYTNTEQFRYF